MTSDPDVRARLSSGSVTLVPLEPALLASLRNAELSEHLAFRWRHHGRHSSPAEFEAILWECLCNFIVLTNGRPTGIVSAYEQDFVNQHCKVAAAAFSSGPSISTTVGALLLIDYLFQGWPFRKLYFETASFNRQQFATHIERLPVQEEGRLSQHLFLDGAYHDLIVLALYREAWQAARHRWLRSS